MEDFDNFFLPALDFEREKRFYKDVLGLQVKFDFSQQGIMDIKLGTTNQH